MKTTKNNAVVTAKENAKNVNENVKNAKSELKNVLTSAFAGINYLNKVVSGKIGGGLLPAGMTFTHYTRPAAMVFEPTLLMWSQPLICECFRLILL